MLIERLAEYECCCSPNLYIAIVKINSLFIYNISLTWTCLLSILSGVIFLSLFQPWLVMFILRFYIEVFAIVFLFHLFLTALGLEDKNTY